MAKWSEILSPWFKIWLWCTYRSYKWVYRRPRGLTPPPLRLYFFRCVYVHKLPSAIWCHWNHCFVVWFIIFTVWIAFIWCFNACICRYASASVWLADLIFPSWDPGCVRLGTYFIVFVGWCIRHLCGWYSGASKVDYWTRWHSRRCWLVPEKSGFVLRKQATDWRSANASIHFSVQQVAIVDACSCKRWRNVSIHVIVHVWLELFLRVGEMFWKKQLAIKLR